MKTDISGKILRIIFSFHALILFGAANVVPRTPPLRANGKIAFTTDRDGNMEIYVMNNVGTGQVRLTNNTARSSTGNVSCQHFGLSGDIPVAGADQ